MYLHIAAVYKFELVVPLLLGHMWGSIGYITYELVPASPAVSCMSGSSNFDSFRDGRQIQFVEKAFSFFIFLFFYSHS